MNRVVTGYDDSGRPAILRQGEPPVVIHAGRYTTTELWVSDRGPLQPTAADASTREWALEPPPGGACFRIVEIAPATGEPAAEAEPLDAGHLDAGHLDAGDLDAGIWTRGTTSSRTRTPPTRSTTSPSCAGT